MSHLQRTSVQSCTVRWYVDTPCYNGCESPTRVGWTHLYMLKLFFRVLWLTVAIEGASLAVANDLILASMLVSTACVAMTAIAISLYAEGQRFVAMRGAKAAG